MLPIDTLIPPPPLMMPLSPRWLPLALRCYAAMSPPVFAAVSEAWPPFLSHRQPRCHAFDYADA